jgi:type I restriction enzyme S subunit
MELKLGYKQTEVGIIPEEWEVAVLGSIASFSSGKGISIAALHGQSASFPVPVFGGNGIAGYTRTPLVRERTVVIGRVGQKCGEVYVTDGPTWITDNALFPRRMHRDCDLTFFGWALKAAELNDVKNRNDLPLLTQSILHAKKIAWPPTTAEQRMIAEALGNVDGLLGGLDQLIAKKRDLKQAAMQQLLTGKTRLPGFSGEWVVKQLGDVIERLVGGGTPSRSNPKFWGNEIPWVTVKDFATFNPHQTQESITELV